MQKVQSGVMAVHIILSPMTGTVPTAVQNLVSRLKAFHRNKRSNEKAQSTQSSTCCRQ